MQVLITCKHGLGDSVQLTIPLQHIKKYRPDWQVDILTLLGKHSCFYGLCNRSLIMKQDFPDQKQYDKIYNLRWRDPCDCNSMKQNVPATKPTLCLVDELQIDPDQDLYHYKINIPPKNRNLAKRYLESLPPNKGIITIHYEGNSSRHHKDINHNVIRYLIQHLIPLNYIFVILDWDERSPLPKESDRIFCPNKNNAIWETTGTGDAATIAALISYSQLFIGIDSGPLHIAGATNTPSIGLWKEHHPVNYFDLANNLVHLLPNDARRYLRGRDKNNVQQYFEQHYKYHYYNSSNFVTRLTEITCELLSTQPPFIAFRETPIVFEEPWKSKVTRFNQGEWWII